MSLSAKIRKVLAIGLANPGKAKELADAIDNHETATAASATAAAASASAAAASALSVIAGVVQPTTPAGTDQAGTDTVVAGGRSTGAGDGGDVITKAAFTGSTGTSANALVERERVVSQRKTIANAGTSLLDIALAASAFASLTIEYGIRCGDGTNFQAIAGVLNVAAVNKGGVYTFTAVDSTACLATSSGTLTLAWDKVDGTNKITLKLTPTTSLTPTTFDVTLRITNHTGTVLTVL